MYITFTVEKVKNQKVFDNNWLNCAQQLKKTFNQILSTLIEFKNWEYIF